MNSYIFLQLTNSLPLRVAVPGAWAVKVLKLPNPQSMSDVYLVNTITCFSLRLQIFNLYGAVCRPVPNKSGISRDTNYGLNRPYVTKYPSACWGLFSVLLSTSFNEFRQPLAALTPRVSSSCTTCSSYVHRRNPIAVRYFVIIFVFSSRKEC